MFEKIVGGIITVVALVGINILYCWQGKRQIKEWAHRNDYELIKSEYRVFNKGSYNYRSTQVQLVYLVTIRDKGHKRKAWIRIGGFLFGWITGEMDVTWEIDEDNHSPSDGEQT